MNKAKLSLKLLICVLVLVGLATLLVACNIGGPAHFDHLVTFVYNTGNIVDSPETQQVGVFDNGLVSIRPGYSNNFKLYNLEGYYFTGWYLPAEVDEEGNPTKDENGFVILGEKWDFKKMRVTEDIKLYGAFEKQSMVHFINRGTGEEVPMQYPIVNTPGTVLTAFIFAPELENHTFLGKYYVAPTGNEEFTFPYTVQETDVNVYVEFLDGEYVLVSTRNQLRTAIATNQNVYLLNDIDCENNESYLWALGTYSGEINGSPERHTIKNVSRTITAARNRQSNFSALFGTLGANAYIHDVNFENVNLMFTLDSSLTSANIFVGLFAWRAQQGARVENVTISGNLRYSLPDDMHVTFSEFIGESLLNPNDIINCNYDNVVVASIK